MTVLALPDITGAMIAHLRSFSEIAALTDTRISAKLQPAWEMPTYAVTLHKTGGPGEDPWVPLHAQRFDVHCWGPDSRTADVLWRMLHACLCPHDGRPRQFLAASTRVYSVDQEGGPIARLDPDTAWPSTFSAYIVRFSEVPA